MAQGIATAGMNVGFLAVLNDPGGYLGGYLVTNHWGRPLEFRLTSAVQPNRVQQILYAGTLESYVCADLIAKALVDKAATAVQCVFTSREAVLDLRNRVAVPVVWIVPPDQPRAAALAAQPHCLRPSGEGRPALACHPRYPEDVPAARALLQQLDPSLDLAEPFQRVVEAVQEARRTGLAKTAA